MYLFMEQASDTIAVSMDTVLFSRDCWYTVEMLAGECPAPNWGPLASVMWGPVTSVVGTLLSGTPVTCSLQTKVHYWLLTIEAAWSGYCWAVPVPAYFFNKQ